MPQPGPSARPDPQTKDRILDAAERLFGERGVAGTSLRAVTAAAEVNVAAVHYHFGSKQALLGAVLERHVPPLNERRLARLDALEARADAALPVETILDAFLRPAFESRHTAPEIRHVAAILQSEPLETVRSQVAELFGEVSGRFVAAFERALPELPPDEVRLRFHFVVGAMIHLLSGATDVAPGELRTARDPGLEGLLARLVSFLAAGLRTPHSPAERSPQK